MKTLASGFALLLLAVPVHAQNADPRWSRWTGCWELVMENSREGLPGPSTATPAPRTQPSDPTRPQVCVVTSNGGATFSTRVGTQTPIVQTVVADGTDRRVTEEDCTGTQRAEWSSDGLRLYSRAELTCKGDPGVRRVSGLAMMGQGGRWTDVQSVDISGRESFRVRQYRRTSGGAAAPNLAATMLTVDDVKEASAKVSPRALEAALVETRASFDLSGRQLLDLQSSGVPASVVDLMVALSYPDRFVIERTARVDRAEAMISDEPFTTGWAFGYAPWSYLDYYYFSPYYYSPFAYPYYRGYNPYFYGSGGYAVDGGGGGGGVDRDRPSGQGRVVDGQGYTRVRPRDAEPTSPTNSNAGSAPLVSGASAPSSGGSSGGSSVSSQGFSSGGSSSGGGGSSSSSSGGSSGGGDGGGRTAQPR